MFAHHVGGLKGGVPPSRVGMQGRQALLHQAKIEKQVMRLSDLHSFYEFVFSKNLSLLTPAPVKTIEMGGTNQALVIIPDGFQKKLLTDRIEFSEHVIEEQERWFSTKFLDQFEFGELEAQDE
jgi:hypothetical protein